MSETPADTEELRVAIPLLVAEFQCGNSNAVEQLVKRFSPVVFGFIRSLLGGTQEAQDVAQETWISIFRSLHKLRDPDAFRPWALQIAHRRSMDFIRKKKKRKEISIECVEESKQLEQQTGKIDPAGLTDDLREVIAELYPQQRTLLKLFYVEEFRIKEIAKIVSQPEGTVKYHLFQIRTQIKNRIERKGKEQ